jgi:hypothetical protein
MTTTDTDPWLTPVEPASAAPATAARDGAVDWVALKREIFGRLDLIAEFRALGVQFVNGHGFNARGVAPCRAIDRPDESPSAFVTAKGLYGDRGGVGRQMDLIDFAVAHGPFGQWTEALRHYAAAAGVEVGRIAKKSGGRVHEATYLYRDAAGRVRYGVFRYKTEKGGKTFTQHPPIGPDGWREGRWKHGPGCMDGVEPLPYRLPEMLAAGPSEPIWVVEGEKCVERLAGLGLVATTSHGGSENTEKTWPRFLGHFAGRDCVVVPDHDRGGHKHARRVCELLAPVARSVRFLELPDLGPVRPKHGLDVFDWLDSGHDVAELRRLLHAAPAFDPGAPAAPEAPEGGDKERRDATLADIRENFNSEEWLWPGWIARGVLCLLAAEGGKGKTRFWMDLVRRSYNSLPWPDGSPPFLHEGDGRYLVVAADNNHRQLANVAEAFGVPDEAIVFNTTAANPYGGTSLQAAEDLEDFEARIARVRPVFAVVDTITNTADYKAQDASDAKKQYKPLQDIAIRTGVPIVCVTHLNASGKTLGRRAVEKARTVIQLSQPDPEGQPNRRRLWVDKTYDITPPELGITMGLEGNEYDTNPPQPPAEERRLNGAARGPVPAKTRACMDWLAGRLGNGARRVSHLRNEAEAEEFSADLLYRAKKELGIEESTQDGRKWWALPAAEANGHANGHAAEAPF